MSKHEIGDVASGRRFGRLAEDPARPRLFLSRALAAGYQGVVPDVVDYSAKVASWPMARNDRLSDCTAADACHALQVWTTYGTGPETIATDEQVTAFYSGSTGYDPADPATDQGGTLQEVCEYYRSTGLAGHRIAAFFRVDTVNPDELRAALWLFGTVSIGMAFPRYAMAQFDRGLPWTVSTHDTTIEGGHDVLLVGAAKGGNYRVVTWGRVQEVSPAFWARYMGPKAGGEAWCRVSAEWLRNGVTPEGLDATAANAAFQQLTGQAGPFPTSTPPSPTPSPPDQSAEQLLDRIGAEIQAWRQQS